MAECVVSSILDTDLNRMVPACVVHAAYTPCPFDGQPACPTPLHTYPLPSREAVVQLWEQRTAGQRRLVVHRNTGELGHDLTETGATCWCGPEVLGVPA